MYFLEDHVLVIAGNCLKSGSTRPIQKENVMLSHPQCHVMLYLPQLVTTVAVQRLWWCL